MDGPEKRFLESLALTVADWARRKGIGEDAVRYARSYAYEAEGKMGEMYGKQNGRRVRKA